MIEETTNVSPSAKHFIRNDSVHTAAEVLSEYVQLNLLAFHYIRNKNYKTATGTFEKCIDLAKDLDEVKHAESLTNYGVCLYYCGNFVESYKHLEKAREITSRLYEAAYKDKLISYLHLRVLCNISLTALSLNKITESKSQFMKCLEIVKSPENNVLEKIEMLKELVYIFFRIESLGNFYETNKVLYDNNLENLRTEDNDFSPQQRMATKALFSFHKTLKENNISHWMKCISEEATKIRKNKDPSGYVFILINQIAAYYCHTGKFNDTLKSTLSSLIKCYQEQFNKEFKFKEKNLTSILSEFKIRMDASAEIYRKINELETELNQKLKENEEDVQKKREEMEESVSCNKFLIKIIFKHTLNFINRQEEQNKGNNETDNNEQHLNTQGHNTSSKEFKTQVELALKLIENNEFDCSMINILNINSEITKSMKILIDNLCIIRNRLLALSAFKKYKETALGYLHRSEYMTGRYVQSEKYMSRLLDKIITGGEVTKVNFRTKGCVKHYYNIGIKEDTGDYCLFVYKNKIEFEKSKPRRIVSFTEISRITYGVCSQNVRKKIKSMEGDFKPWLFLSFHLPKKSIDFYFEDEANLCTWFYGLSYFLSSYTVIKTQIMSTSAFLITKLKLKMAYQLKKFAAGPENAEEDEEEEEEEDGMLMKALKLHLKASGYDFNFRSLSFVKSLLLYKKLNDNKINY